MKKLLAITILLGTQNIKADALSDAIRKSDVAVVRELFYASCHSPERMHFYKELAQETIQLRREAVMVQDLLPRADSNNPVSNRYFNASEAAIGITLLTIPAWPFITKFLYGKCPGIEFGDRYKETSAMQDTYWEKELNVLYGCLGISCLSLYIAAHCLDKSIETASISTYNHYDEAVTIKEILNDYEGCKF